MLRHAGRGCTRSILQAIDLETPEGCDENHWDGEVGEPPSFVALLPPFRLGTGKVGSPPNTDSVYGLGFRSRRVLGGWGS